MLYTTHYMEEAQDLCDRLAIIDHGKLLAMGTLDELRRLIGEKDIVRLTGQFNAQAARTALAGRRRQSKSSRPMTRALLLAVEGATRKLPEIFAAIAAAGGEIQETSLSQPSLESAVHQAHRPGAAGVGVRFARIAARKDLRRRHRRPGRARHVDRPADRDRRV